MSEETKGNEEKKASKPAVFHGVPSTGAVKSGNVSTQESKEKTPTKRDE